MKIDIISSKSSWLCPYILKLAGELRKMGHKSEIFFDKKVIKSGNILLILGCEQVLSKSYLCLYSNNVRVNESNFSFENGWPPLTLQILEGKIRC